MLSKTLFCYILGISFGFYCSSVAYSNISSPNVKQFAHGFSYPAIVNFEVDKAVFILPKIGCHIITDRSSLTDVIFITRQYDVYQTDAETVDDLILLCLKFQSKYINATEFVSGLRDFASLVYPGTKWCGVGNSADNETDLGFHTSTDKCCRDHDLCDNFVLGWTCHKENGLCNQSPFTRSHCNCDENFRQCLLQINDTVSEHVGTLFFTVFGLQCFREDFPIIECKEYGGFLNIHCQEYLLNTSESKSFQFFDSPKFLNDMSS